MKEVKIAIIGAGMAGLTLAKKLKGTNADYLIIEKSRGLGGRIATRRIEDSGFDHGAPYLYDSETLREMIDLDFIESSQGIFVKTGMTSIPKKLGHDLCVMKDQRVTDLKREQGKWILKTDKNELIRASIVVLTAPLPQSLELLDKNQINISHKDELQSVEYAKSILALMISQKEDLLMKFSSDIHSILNLKRRDLHPNGWVVRMTDQFSETHFENSDEDLMEYFRSIGTDISHIEIKKWRYACPRKALPYSYLEAAQDLYLIGDAFKYPDIRGSLAGALELATKLV